MGTLLQTIEFSLQIAQKTRCFANWRAKGQCIPMAKLYYITGGWGELFLQGRRIELSPGKLVGLPSYTPQDYHTPDHVDIQWAHFSAELSGGVDIFHFLQVFEVIPPEDFPVEYLMGRLRRAYRRPSEAAEFETAGVLRQLITPFVAASNPEVRSQHRRQQLRFKSILQFVDSQLHRVIRVEELAELMRLETTHFSRQFRRMIGCPPARYIRQRRLERAQRMLWQTNSSLAEIAEELGFSDAFHLSKMFKKQTGLSPRQFRQQRQNIRP